MTVNFQISDELRHAGSGQNESSAWQAHHSVCDLHADDTSRGDLGYEFRAHAGVEDPTRLPDRAWLHHPHRRGNVFLFSVERMV